MAKKQAFGEDAKQRKGSHRKMAKVIISNKVSRGKVNYREAMVGQDNVMEYISKNRA